jgi:hypothetical protein
MTRPFRLQSKETRQEIERALNGLPARPGESMEAQACRMDLKGWHDLMVALRTAYPVQWADCQRQPVTYQLAWSAAVASYEAGKFRETADLLCMAAIWEAQNGGKSSVPAELLCLAFLYGLAGIFKGEIVV